MEHLWEKIRQIHRKTKKKWSFGVLEQKQQFDPFMTEADII